MRGFKMLSTCVDCGRSITNNPAGFKTTTEPNGWRRVVGPLCQQCFKEKQQWQKQNSVKQCPTT